MPLEWNVNEMMKLIGNSSFFSAVLAHNWSSSCKHTSARGGLFDRLSVGLASFAYIFHYNQLLLHYADAVMLEHE
jgi:hypothetical protein